MNSCFNQPLHSLPPAQNLECLAADYGRSAPENMPGNLTSIYSNSDVAKLLLRDFEYFRSPDNSFVSRDSLVDVANRPLGNGGYDDQMTLLARDILGRPGVASLLDGVQNGGREDGLINREDVQLAISQLDQQDACAYQPRAGMQFAGGYNGAMQQQRINQQCSPQFDAPPSPGGPRGMEGWEALPPESRMDAPQQPPYAGMRNDPQWSPVMAAGRSYANDSDESLSAKVLSHFSNLQDASLGKITDASLSAAASGYSLDGRPVSAADASVAQELMERGELFKTLDQGRSGALDGNFSRQDLADVSNAFRKSSDGALLQAVKDNFRQFTAGADDHYVNVSELKEAAGVIPSTRAFNPQAREVASELLNRPGLLRELDIGIREEGKPGAEDQRFDMVNIDHMIKKAPSNEGNNPSASAFVGNLFASAGGQS
ncbi:hypothetical protein [Pseudomonas sp.]|uniref:hypothetical protein n=1 Tax=Pseudomonas sp. TaxID=306 RepID=UPI002638218D|nr:hypothetical protein [Pseudomonas sp.]